MREVTLNEICKQKVIAIVRGLNKDEAVKAAKALYEDKEKFKKFVSKVMRTDFSWGRSAEEYMRMYEIR